MAMESLTSKVAVLVTALFIIYKVYSFLTSPLSSIPGPFWAKFSDLWRLLDFWNCTQIQSHQTLHEKFGPAVRIGPNLVSLSDPELLKTVYSSRGDYVKVRASNRHGEALSPLSLYSFLLVFL